MRDIKIKSKLFILILMMLVAGQGFIFSAIKATYVPAPSIKFKLGNTVEVPPSTPLGTFSASQLVAHIGTIKITRDNDETDRYYRPLLVNYRSTESIYVDGKLTVDWSDTRTEFVYYFHNSMLAQPYRTGLSGNAALYAWDYGTVITPNPYYIQIFLVSHQPASHYIEGETYEIVSGYTVGSFNIKVLRKDPWGREEYIPVNEQDTPTGGNPPNDDPISITTGTSGGSEVFVPEIVFGGDDPPPDPNFEVSFNQDSVNFNLNEAYLPSNKKEINTVEIKVFDGIPGGSYGVDIAFTDSGETNSFQLKHSGGGSPIDYNLYFGTSSNIVDYGEPISWGGLALPPNRNEKSLWIGGIAAEQVQQRLSGSYSDTVYVNIISTF